MKQQNIIIILIFSSIVTIAWVIFSIHHASVAGTLTTTVIEQIIPIAPTFDQAVIDETKTRQPVDPVYQLQGETSQSASGSGITTPQTPAPQGSPSNATPSANSL